MSGSLIGLMGHGQGSRAGGGLELWRHCSRPRPCRPGLPRSLSALIRQKEILESPNAWLVRVCALCPPATLVQGVQI